MIDTLQMLSTLVCALLLSVLIPAESTTLRENSLKKHSRRSFCPPSYRLPLFITSVLNQSTISRRSNASLIAGSLNTHPVTHKSQQTAINDLIYVYSSLNFHHSLFFTHHPPPPGSLSVADGSRVTSLSARTDPQKQESSCPFH
ncbi:hypothetical protein E1301_Tti013325 [Triplophysa tibetana]|uniref:Secreted protein n=1 Tax=Triplophysa tibetana TaxID=1572043 RepID=A0A5A9MYW0_9TELE|nr:hypothetical protein E1301_Tti013325 [Triplophysa tibetana]